MRLSWLGLGDGGGQKGRRPRSAVSDSRVSIASDIIRKFRAQATFTSSARLNLYNSMHSVCKASFKILCGT